LPKYNSHMGWIHCNRQLGAYLALAALALQIALSFGHVHLSTVSDGSLSAATHRATLTQAQLPAQSPGGDNDYCAICASIFLASTSFAPAPPALPLPVNFHVIGRSFNHALYLIELQRLGFQSRAPPAT
jgi:hypothetical protein